VIVKGLALYQMAYGPGALLPVIMFVITMMTDFRVCELMSKACAMVRIDDGISWTMGAIF
jgi:hypothetical protein